MENAEQPRTKRRATEQIIKGQPEDDEGEEARARALRAALPAFLRARAKH